MTRKFILTLKPDTRLTGINVQAYIDALRKDTNYVESVVPIVEMGTPMTDERLEELRSIVKYMVEVEDGRILSLCLEMQELLTEADRARGVEFVVQKALQVAAHERKERDVTISVLEQRLAQYGVEERR